MMKPCQSFILKIRLKIPLRNFGDLTTTIFMAASFLYLRMQPKPQAISKNATRNRRNPVGKITAIRIPRPSVTAQAPIQRQFLILFPPCLLVYYHYIQRGDGGAQIQRDPRKPPEVPCVQKAARHLGGQDAAQCWYSNSKSYRLTRSPSLMPISSSRSNRPLSRSILSNQLRLS